jgi:hypothetical protein
MSCPKTRAVPENGLVEAQQRVQQRGLARSVGSQQADRAARERGRQLLQNDARAEAKLQGIQLDNLIHRLF